MTQKNNMPSGAPLENLLSDFKNLSSQGTAGQSNADYFGAKVPKLLSSLKVDDVVGGLRNATQAIQEINRKVAEETKLTNDTVKVRKEYVKEIQEQINQHQQLAAQTRTELAVLTSISGISKKRLQDAEETAKEYEAVVVKAKEDLALAKDLLSYEQKRKRAIEERGKAASDETRNVRDRLQYQKEMMDQMFGSQLAKNNFNLPKTLQQWGQRKKDLGIGGVTGMGEGANSGMGIGSVVGGALGMAVGAGLGMAISKIGDMFMQSIKTSFIRGDVYKTGAAPGESYRNFTGSVHGAIENYGISTDEEAQMMQIVLKAGRDKRPGSFANVMGSSAVLGRAYGMDLNESTSFMSGLVRKTNVTESSSDQNKILLGIADAVGRGGLGGLQEETLKGITELVELTRSANISGVNPLAFADMIANLSSLPNNKNLRGGDAAKALTSISQGMSEPKTDLGMVASFRALDKITAEYASRGIVDLDEKTGKPRGQGDDYFPFRQQQMSQGVGLKINGHEAGLDYVGGFLDQIANATGDVGFAQMALSSATGLSPEASRLAIMNKDRIKSHSTLRSTYNIDENLPANTGTIALINQLGTSYDELSKKGLTGEELKKQALLNAAQNTKFIGLDDVKFKQTLDNNKNKDSDTLAKALFGAASQVSSTAPTDPMRQTVEKISTGVSKLVDSVVPAMAGLIGWITSGSRSEAARQIKQQQDLQKLADSGADARDVAIAQTADKGIIPSYKHEESLDKLADAVRVHEGWRPGSRSFRNNNPGNLEELDGTFRHFDNFEAGNDALKMYLAHKVNTHPDWSYKQFFTKYLGGDPNNMPADGNIYVKGKLQGNANTYAKDVADRMGFSPDDKIGYAFLHKEDNNNLSQYKSQKTDVSSDSDKLKQTANEASEKQNTTTLRVISEMQNNQFINNQPSGFQKGLSVMNIELGKGNYQTGVKLVGNDGSYKPSL